MYMCVYINLLLRRGHNAYLLIQQRQRLTEDEYRVLRECNQESFFQRC